MSIAECLNAEGTADPADPMSNGASCDTCPGSPESRYTLTTTPSPHTSSDFYSVVSPEPGTSSQPYIPNYYKDEGSVWTQQEYYGENNNIYDSK